MSNKSEKTQKEPVDVGVIHGRFQVLHNDHLKYLQAGKKRCRHLVVGITNPDPSLTKENTADPARSSAISNPLSYFERQVMLRLALLEAGIPEKDFSIVPFPINFPELLRYYIPLNATFFLTILDDWGRQKLAMFQSLGLKTEVLWEKPPDQRGLRGSKIRQLIAEGTPWEHLVPGSSAKLIKNWDLPTRLRTLPD